MHASIATDGERAVRRRTTAGQPNAGAAYDVEIPDERPEALRTAIRLFDRGAVVVYRLGARGKGHRWAFGFTEYVIEADGSTSKTPVSAAEVMAVAREVDREHDVTAIVEAALPYVTPRNARRLRAELAAGRNLDRVALPKIQAAILK